MDFPIKVIIISVIYVYLFQTHVFRRCQGCEYNNSSLRCIVKLRGLPWTATEADVLDFLGWLNCSWHDKLVYTNHKLIFYSNSSVRCIVKLRGLPWTATEEDVVDFLGWLNYNWHNKLVYTHHKLIFYSNSSVRCIVKLRGLPWTATEEDVVDFLGWLNYNWHNKLVYTHHKLIFYSNSSVRCIVKLRGLPWTATEEDVVDFLDDCNVMNGTMGVHLIKTKEGRASGVAFVELESQNDLELAYKKDGQYLGERYIEVFYASVSEMQRSSRRSEQSIQRAMTDACVRIRGLPYKTSERDVLNFFEGLDVLPKGVSLVYDDQGRTTGEAYVQFVDQDMAERALDRHMGRLYHRYIEVYRSSLGEMRLAQSQQSYSDQAAEYSPNTQDRPRMMNNRGYDMLRPLRFSGYPERYVRGAWNGGRDPSYDQNYERHQGQERTRYLHGDDGRDKPSLALHMRGLPYDATEEDIKEFFSPVVPIGVDFHFNSRGKPSGQADVIFKTHEDLQQAMKRNNNYIKHRYIELFE